MKMVLLNRSPTQDRFLTVRSMRSKVPLRRRLGALMCRIEAHRLLARITEPFIVRATFRGVALAGSYASSV